LQFLSESNPKISKGEFTAILRGPGDRGNSAQRIRVFAKMLRIHETQTTSNLGDVFIPLKQAGMLGDIAEGEISVKHVAFFGIPWAISGFLTSKFGFNLLTNSLKFGQGANEIAANTLRLGLHLDQIIEASNAFYSLPGAVKEKVESFFGGDPDLSKIPPVKPTTTYQPDVMENQGQQ
jgi:hypothetical protein